MGWWKIKDVHTGQIDFEAVKLRKMSPEYNDEVLVNGDEPADILGDALKKVDKAYLKAWDRHIKIDECHAAWNFVVNGFYRMLHPAKHGKDVMCPECQGQGKIQTDTSGPGEAKYLEMLKCDFCEGHGWMIAFPKPKERK